MKASPRTDFKSYFIALSILTIILMVVYFFIREMVPYNVAYVVPSLYIITAVAHWLLTKSMSKDAQKFQMYFFAASGFKILAYLGVLTVIALAAPPVNIEFVVSFFIAYLCYTIFEMAIVLPRAKRN